MRGSPGLAACRTVRVEADLGIRVTKGDGRLFEPRPMLRVSSGPWWVLREVSMMAGPIPGCMRASLSTPILPVEITSQWIAAALIVHLAPPQAPP